MGHRQKDQGFTLVELLLAIVIVGILSAVAIVGLTGMTSTGNKSACNTLIAAAQTAATTYYANTGMYPVTTGSPDGFDLLVQGPPALMTLPNGVTESGDVMKQGTAWSVTMGGGGGSTANTYTKTGAC